MPRRTFAEDLLKWWAVNGRSFPWRSDNDAYRTLVAEVLLHRTRASGVTEVYSRFVTEIPTIEDLALKSEDEIDGFTGTLGLRWRSRMLLEMAQSIVTDFSMQIPSDFNQLKSLPGVGQYIASAVRVFSFGFQDALIDVNTVRVISRVERLKNTDSLRRDSSIPRYYHALQGSADSREFGYAMIDLAALVCVSIKPKCHDCPVANHCISAFSVVR